MEQVGAEVTENRAPCRVAVWRDTHACANLSQLKTLPTEVTRTTTRQATPATTREKADT